MEAKDTVMGIFQRNKFHNLGRLKTEFATVEERDKAMCLAQAEISFKAGYKQRKDEELPYYTAIL